MVIKNNYDDKSPDWRVGNTCELFFFSLAKMRNFRCVLSRAENGKLDDTTISLTSSASLDALQTGTDVDFGTPIQKLRAHRAPSFGSGGKIGENRSLLLRARFSPLEVRARAIVRRSSHPDWSLEQTGVADWTESRRKERTFHCQNELSKTEKRSIQR